MPVPADRPHFKHWPKRLPRELVVPETSLVGEAGEDDPQTLVTPSYPGRGADLGQQWLPLSGEQQTMVSPAGGAPTALTNLPGTGGALGAASSFVGYALGVLPGQAAVDYGRVDTVLTEQLIVELYSKN